ncbi:MAG: class I SAM-dependent methyltransferase [Saprospiraceae bacterium]|nr:class I SAM-dependent methyltransferase [Bacteroidia bacterium]NNE13759.1 class I SAM-dependent methyltransferase [Saprospiraceae bacterium]NNL91746.1 class I SAM-dependent methyltransferase [Saprospiraceae bacterium]
MQEKDSCCITDDGSREKKEYWDANFEKNETPNWIETEAPWIMTWINDIDLSKEATIFCAGVGNANIVEHLLQNGYKNIIANDISQVALDTLSSRVNNNSVTYLQDDLISPKKIQDYKGKIDLYIDRATLHFFTKCAEKDHYFSQMQDLLKTGGHTVIGVFSKDNKPKCCGLDLQLWSIQSLHNRMPDYNHTNSTEFAYKELNGNIRNYIYLLAQKQ